VIRAALCPNEPLPPAEAAVVVDVIRATTTAVALLEAGALELWLAPDHETALALKGEGFLIAGETAGLRPPGFDLGNSPREALAAPVAGKRVVMSTTNGTRAAHRAADRARKVALGSLWNLSAVARWARGKDPLLLVAAGKEGRWGLDDAYVLGALLEKLGSGEGDGCRAARTLFHSFPDAREALAASEAARALQAVGLEADVRAAAETDRSQVVPVLQRREGPYLVFRRSGS